jgi:hypothetical protein
MVKQVTATTTAAVILTPSNQMKVALIQNNDATNGVRLSFDGGATYTDPRTGGVGTNPTVNTGYFLAIGKEISINTVWGDAGLHVPVVAIAVAGTAVLDIVTDDWKST